VLLSTATHVVNTEFEQHLAAIPAIVEVLDLAGPVDYHIRVDYQTQRQLYDIVQTLRTLPGVTGIETRPVLRRLSLAPTRPEPTRPLSPRCADRSRA
jgi:DNA-binding Lrp family transcriptional regulator